MDKEVLVHIYNGILLSYTIQSEVSQKEKHQYGIVTHIYIYMEFRKMVTRILYARQQKRHRCKEQTITGLCGRRQGWADMREQH